MTQVKVLQVYNSFGKPCMGWDHLNLHQQTMQNLTCLMFHSKCLAEVTGNVKLLKPRPNFGAYLNKFCADS